MSMNPTVVTDLWRYAFYSISPEQGRLNRGELNDVILVSQWLSGFFIRKNEATIDQASSHKG